MNESVTFVTFLLMFCLWCWCANNAVNGATVTGVNRASGVCPESKRRYPGDCRLFYRCVLLPVPTSTVKRTPSVAHAHVWIPTRCTAGLVFEATRKKCVVPDGDWDCRNDDQLIPISRLPLSTEPPQPEEVTEDEHLVTDKIDEYNLVIPHVIEYASDLNSVEEESEIITDRIDRLVSTTSRPGVNSYHLAITRNPYISVTDVNVQSQSVDPIATQMDRIANLAPSLKAVANTEAPGIWRRTTTESPNIWRRPITVTKTPGNLPQTVSGTVATPVSVSHTQIPRPGGVNVIINPPVAHFSTEPHYELNLLPIHLNRLPGQYIPTKHSAALNAHQQQSNFNLYGSNVLKHIVDQTANRNPSATIDQQNTERLVSALFNKYLANKTFIKKTGNNGVYFVSPVYTPMEIPGSDDQNGDLLTGIRHVPISLRVKQGNSDYTTSTPPSSTSLLPASTAAAPHFRPCIPGVRFPNATDCRRYYMCNASSASIHTYTCPPYTAFDKVRRMCDVSQFASCVNPTGTEYNIDGSNFNDSLVSVQLPPNEICDTRDKLPDPTSPRRYILCVKSNDGRWTRHQMTCPGLLIYCPTRNFCAPKSNCY